MARFILLVLAFLATPLISFAADLSKLESGKTYLFQLRSNIELVVARYAGLNPNKKLTLVTSVKSQVVAPSDVVDFEVLPTFMGRPHTTSKAGGFLTWLSTLADAHEISWLTTHRYKTLAERDGVKIAVHTGPSRHTVEDAQRVLADFEKFDGYVMSLGFNKPKSTRVILAEDYLSLGMSGPFAYFEPTYNIWSRTRDQNIVINPILHNTRGASTPSVYLHERMHLILFNTYQLNNFTSFLSPLQEGLADFFAANMTGDPVVGRDCMGPGVHVRDISQRVSGRNSVTTMLEFSKAEAHSASVVFSNVLWEMRELVGEKKLQPFLKPMIDDLNFYYPSFSGIVLNKTDQWKDPRQFAILSFAHFMTALRRSALDNVKLDAETAVKLYDYLAAKSESYGLNVVTIGKIGDGYQRWATPPMPEATMREKINRYLNGGMGILVDILFPDFVVGAK